MAESSNSVMKFYMKLIILFLALWVQCSAYAHGVTSATANIQARPANLLEIKVQFNLIDLLNYKAKNYTLMQLVALNEQQFSRLYNEVKKLFLRDLIVKNGHQHYKINPRFPSSKQVLQLLKRQFLQTKVVKGSLNRPYTFSDRRFYQVFYFDFLLSNQQDIEQLKISFPKPLGSVYTTFTRAFNKEVHKGSQWQFSQ